MIRGLYSAASGIKAQAARTEIYASNLANVSTSGYLRSRVSQASFPSELAASAAFAEATGKLAGGVTVSPGGIDFTPGAVQQTSNALDLAIVGKGFFCVETPEGIAYTRNGQFKLDKGGTIVSHEGYPLLGKRGPIRISSDAVTVNGHGQVSDDNRIVDTLQIVDIPRSAQTSKRGAALLAASNTIPATDFTVQQGAIEGSNVSAMQELQRMMSGQREYEANIRSIQAQDDTLSVLLRDVVG